MKRAFYFLAFCIAAGSVTGCGEKKKDNNIITTKKEVKVPATPVRMQEYVQEKKVEWLGGVYTVDIRRSPDDSLAIVKDENGQKFVDNRISLKVSRSDGSVFVNRTFTKASFDAQLTDDYRETGVLEGFVFDKVEGQTLVFAASVCHPQTDEYIPLVVKLSRMGDVSVMRDTQMDTSSDADEDI